MKNPIEFVKEHKKAAFIVTGLVIGAVVTGVIIYTKQTKVAEAALDAGEAIGTIVEAAI